MIGVIGSRADLEIAEEFFELFKTPWEPAVAGRTYSAVLSVDGRFESLDTELFLMFGSEPSALDRQVGVNMREVVGPTDVSWAESTLPVYGRLSVFDCSAEDASLRSGTGAVEYRHQLGPQVVRRIGYDLFREVRLLLTEGQPSANALAPTLELHIALLRHLLVKSGIAFVEIPPRPAGYDFVCCLTHDLDFFGLRRHAFDRTLGGFIARASVGTLADLVRRRRTLAEAARNWLSLASLPLVFLGLIKDPWSPFADYAGVEDTSRSTFFLLPFKNRPGVSPNGTTDSRRAVAYDVTEISEEARQAFIRGSELGVHGIDAWRDSEAGQIEMSRLLSVTGQRTAGVRMHWLYFADDSPKRLEQAGFEYDSTCGYNDAVGFRAGTSQVFRLLGTETLLELPLLIMDSALFFPGRMGLSSEDALARWQQIIADVRHFGGTFVINWHDRSLAPERLWQRSYTALLNDVQAGNRVWFATAAEAVHWFRWRRSIRFASDGAGNQVGVNVPAASAKLPPCTIEIHRPGAAIEPQVLDSQTAQSLWV